MQIPEPSPVPHAAGDPGSAFPETGKLVLRWRSARRDGDLPFYEDVALGSLGAVADHLGLVTPEGAGRFRFLRAGPALEAQIGRDLAGLSCDELELNYRAALGDGLCRAIASRAPASGLARCVQDGLVGTCELMTLPLRNRWGGILILVYLRQRPETHDLVEAIYGSTSDGLIALAAVGDQSGHPDFQIVSLNGGAARLFDRPEAAVRWRMMSDLVPLWGRDGLREALVRALAEQRPCEFEHAIPRSSADCVHLRISVAPVGDLLAIALTDVTAMKRREDSVRLLFESNPMPLIVYDRSTLAIRRVNDAMAAICGRSASDLLETRWPDLFGAADRAALTKRASRAAPPAGERRHWCIERGDGPSVAVEIYANDLVFGGRDCVLASIHDVTEQRRAQSKIDYLAHHDDLTGLANRILFRKTLERGLGGCRRQGEMVAVHCIDLDFFKRINDTLGHGAGDEVLRCVADRIKAALGAGDLAARLGGDEFAVIQTGLSSPAEASRLAARLIERLSAPYVLEGRQAALGASIGVSLAPGDGLEADILLQNADIALYRSKTGGRGMHHFFEAGMDQTLQTRRSLEADLRTALDRGELELFYQPVVAAGSLELVGFEALLRWFHPERGAVPPQTFIPVAEEVGIIDAIGDWVLREACAEASRWARPCKVAVNLSALQFRRGALARTVAAALATTGLAPARLELEITETVFLGENAANLATLRALRALGVSISLDDFGTGYSSLSYLSRFPVDKIKIDRSFIRDMDDTPRGLAIIRAVVSLGANLGIETLAEGVETVEQLERLRHEGCSEIQGYLTGRPMPAPRLPALMAADRAPPAAGQRPSDPATRAGRAA